MSKLPQCESKPVITETTPSSRTSSLMCTLENSSTTKGCKHHHHRCVHWRTPAAQKVANTIITDVLENSCSTKGCKHHQVMSHATTQAPFVVAQPHVEHIYGLHCHLAFSVPETLLQLLHYHSPQIKLKKSVSVTAALFC
jgi:hypothetical protein